MKGLEQKWIVLGKNVSIQSIHRYLKNLPHQALDNKGNESNMDKMDVLFFFIYRRNFEKNKNRKKFLFI